MSYIERYNKALEELRKQPWAKTSDGMAWGRQVLLSNLVTEPDLVDFNMMVARAARDGCFVDDGGLLDPNYNAQDINAERYLIETTEDDPNT